MTGWLRRRQAVSERRRWVQIQPQLHPQERPLQSLYCSKITDSRGRSFRGFAFLTNGAVYVTEGEQPEYARYVTVLPIDAMTRVAPHTSGFLAIDVVADDEGSIARWAFQASLRPAMVQFSAMLATLHQQEPCG